MRSFVVNTVVTAVAFYVLTRVLPDAGVSTGVKYAGELAGLLVLAAIFGVVNGLIGPVVRILAFPLNLMTMGLIGFVINGGLLLATAYVANSTGFDLQVGDFPPDITADTIVAAILGSIVLSVVGSVVRLVVHD
ncbi:MAG: phage holin family protein [Chloroflexi bacterium]|nr:phage holin family protein [Chloroflexota bacterium]